MLGVRKVSIDVANRSCVSARVARHSVYECKVVPAYRGYDLPNWGGSFQLITANLNGQSGGIGLVSW